jgi:hypothetical protein
VGKSVKRMSKSDRSVEEFKNLYLEYESLIKDIKSIEALAAKCASVEDLDITFNIKINDKSDPLASRAISHDLPNSFLEAVNQSIMQNMSEPNSSGIRIISLDELSSPITKKEFKIDSHETFMILERIVNYKQEKLTKIKEEIKQFKPF